MLIRGIEFLSDVFMLGIGEVATHGCHGEIDEGVSIVGFGFEHPDDERREECSKAIEAMGKGYPAASILARDQEKADIEGCVKEVMPHSKEVHGDKLADRTIPEHKDSHEDSIDHSHSKQNLVLQIPNIPPR